MYENQKKLVFWGKIPFYTYFFNFFYRFRMCWIQTFFFFVLPPKSWKTCKNVPLYDISSCCQQSISLMIVDYLKTWTFVCCIYDQIIGGQDLGVLETMIMSNNCPTKFYVSKIKEIKENMIFILYSKNLFSKSVQTSQITKKGHFWHNSKPLKCPKLSKNSPILLFGGAILGQRLKI